MTLLQMQNLVQRFEITMEMLYVLLLMKDNNSKDKQAYNSIIIKYKDKILNDKEVDALLEKELIVQVANGKGYKTTKKFNDIFVDKHASANEFFNAYPSFVRTGDKFIPLKNVDIKVVQTLYEHVVKTTDEHYEMMNILDFARINNFGLVKIDSYLSNKVYLQVQELMYDDDNPDNTNIERNYNE